MTLVAVAAALYIFAAAGPTVVRLFALVIVLGLIVAGLYVAIALLLIAGAPSLWSGIKEGWNETCPSRNRSHGPQSHSIEG